MMDDQGYPARSGQGLAELVGSRLCHDLSNPLGAIGNGVELLDMTGSAHGPEMELIREAVADAQARVRFFRLAFGAAGAEQLTSAREAAGTLQGFFRAGRITPDWTGTRDLPRQEVKLAYLMALCAECALPMGGDLSVAALGPGQWQLHATGKRVTMQEETWSVLRFGAGAAGRALRPAEAQFLALYCLAEDMGLTVNYRAEDGVLHMSTR